MRRVIATYLGSISILLAGNEAKRRELLVKLGDIHKTDTLLGMGLWCSLSGQLNCVVIPFDLGGEID